MCSLDSYPEAEVLTYMGNPFSVFLRIPTLALQDGAIFTPTSTVWSVETNFFRALQHLAFMTKGIFRGMKGYLSFDLFLIVLLVFVSHLCFWLSSSAKCLSRFSPQVLIG